MTSRQALTVNFDPQARAREFAVDDWVTPIGADNTDVGRVVSVWPGLGVVDVEWGTGYRRMNVEDIAKIGPNDAVVPPEHVENVPGGLPVRPGREASGRKPDPSRIATAFIKEGIYWASKDRSYRATRQEIESGSYMCPRCRDCDNPMLPKTYKQESGKKVKLMACPSCMYLIKIDNIIGHPRNEVDEPEPEPIAEPDCADGEVL